MSEFINNSLLRKNSLKDILRRLHKGEDFEILKRELEVKLEELSYGEVVEAEQELIEEGVPVEELIKMCDLHSKMLDKQISLVGIQIVPPGHPVDTFRKENREIEKVCNEAKKEIDNLLTNFSNIDVNKSILSLRAKFNLLMDIDKHYLRKEHLLFPFLEKGGVAGPPKVMWGKHDEIRELLRGSIEALANFNEPTQDEFESIAEFLLKPSINMVVDMITKEEKILFPMSLDKLSETDWYEIYLQTPEIGFCLYDPQVEWKPSGIEIHPEAVQTDGEIQFTTGSMTKEELSAILSTLPIDITFVDKNDRVKYFSNSNERIFQRSRAILKRDVRLCHPPSSVHIVDKIINDFKNGVASRAPFWINFRGKFVHIEYFALRNEQGEYLGTLEVTQDLTELRQLEGEQRILSYKTNEQNGK